MSEINFNSLKSHDGTVSEAEFNRAIDVMARLVLNNGLNYTVSRSAAGTTIIPGGKSGGASASCPFTVKIGPVSGDPSSITVTISPGTVGQKIPSNMFDPFTISKSGTFYVKAGVETDGQQVSTITLYVDSSEPDQQTPVPFALPSSFDVLLAIISEGKAYRTIACGSVDLEGHEEFRTDKSPPAEPGEMVYTPYYKWSIS